MSIGISVEQLCSSSLYTQNSLAKSFIKRLYQASLEKKKRKNCVEANCVFDQDNDIFDPSNITNFDVADFFETLKEKIDTVGGTTNVSFDLKNI